MSWHSVQRPGYFGRRRDEKIAHLNRAHGEGNWRLVWIAADREPLEFADACKAYYEESYTLFLQQNAGLLGFVCEFLDVYDNALSNRTSGLDYTKQEAYSTHIQDIAVRNAVKHLGKEFNAASKELLQIRGADTLGWSLGPGNVPFHIPGWITQPSMRPRWAQENSVEDFWQSNKWIQVRA